MYQNTKVLFNFTGFEGEVNSANLHGFGDTSKKGML